MPDGLGDVLNFSGTLFVVAYHGSWMAVALAIGIWVGWRMAGEGLPGAPQPPGETVPDDPHTVVPPPEEPARSEEGA